VGWKHFDFKKYSFFEGLMGEASLFMEMIKYRWALLVV